MINYDDFKKVEITIGKIISAEKIPETDKLLLLKVDFGTKKVLVPAEKLSDDKKPEEIGAKEEPDESVEPTFTMEPDIRQIVSGISAYFPELDKLIGTRCAFVTNLEPRKIKGYESNGMILAVGGEGEPFSLFKMDEEIKPGTQAR
jgi:tRNA-binding EMAP/Myf-like protein